MSFSTDLDAVRQRVGIPTVHRLKCECGARLVTIKVDRAERFNREHYGITTQPRVRYHRLEVWVEGPARFRIKRFPLGSSTDPVWPWRVHDAERPGVFGRARTHAAAIELVGVMQANPGQAAQVLDDDDEVIATINGAGAGQQHPRLERHINAQCSVVPILGTKRYATLGDIADELGQMLDDGMTAESIQYGLLRALEGHRRA